MGIVCGKGINDMPWGWASESEYNQRLYQVWHNMINRCYSEKYHETQPTYVGCTVADRWLTLSNFVEDIKLIPNYDYWLNNPNQRVALDKDIKSNGTNKCYCLENCYFTTIEENCRQAINSRTTLIDRFDKQGNLIDTKYQFEYVQMGFNQGNIGSCCKGKRKSCQGFIFKYHEDK